MSTRGLIDQLRSEELDSIASEVRNGRRGHILKTLDERGRAQELVRQQYTGRYPFELLQNANDAAGDANASGSAVCFVLTEEALVVADQGAGFGEAQIKAICGLGRSSKDPRKSIGYKGLGFKSVGEITDRPQIISGAVRFTFDNHRVRAAVGGLTGDFVADQRLPVYAFPFPLGDDELGNDMSIINGLIEEGYHTVFRLPFKHGITPADVQTHLQQTIIPRLLLFLDATEKLELRCTDTDFSAMIAREQRGDYTEALLENAGENEHWLVFERRLDIPDRQLVEALGDAWKQVDQVRVAAAVPLDDDGKPTVRGRQPLHVYFPTQEQSGFSFILQADFALELDRRHIAISPEAIPYNHWLSEEVGKLVGECVGPSLAMRFPGDSSVVSALAPSGEGTDFGQRVWSDTLTALRPCPFIPCVDGKTRRPGEVLLLPEDTPAPEKAHAVLDLSGLGRLVHHGVEIEENSRTFLSKYLEVEELSLNDLLDRLHTPASDQVAGFFEYLVSWSEKVGTRKFSALLGSVPCVRILGGRWIAPKDGVFFPRQRGDIEFPSDLSVPIADLPDVDGLRPLLESAGVRPFEWRALLPEFVLPLLMDESTPDERRAPAIQALRAYFESERTGDPRLKVQLARVLVNVRDARNSRQARRPTGNTYFSAEWLDDDRLERIYGPFEQIEFLCSSPPEDDDERRRELAFYEWLGVSQYPRIDERRTDQRDTFMVYALSRHPHRLYEDLWNSWLNISPVRVAQQCAQGHTYSQQLRVSYSLDRFPELVRIGDAIRLELLWHALVDHWGTVYEPAMKAEFYCQNNSHAGDRVRTAPSMFAHMLRELEWLPCVRNREPVLVKPASAWRVIADTPRRIVERVCALPRTLDTPNSAQLASLLGIVDAARPAPGDLIALLKELAVEQTDVEETDEQSPALYAAARWAMRSLNDVLEERQDVKVGDVPLLARKEGRHLFHTHPFVAEDALLAETWESSFPILDADRDLRVLHRVLSLRKLDEEVTVRPVPVRPRPDLRDRLEHQIEQAKPYLAAVAVEAVPSRRDDIFRGLARLEVMFCDDLVLEYELDGEVRQRTEAVSYIAVRQEQEGSIRRNIGTAYLEVDLRSGQPHWFAFGPQLAQFLRVPSQGDAFSLLLQASKEDRGHFLISRRISLDAVDDARIRLDQPPDDEVLDDLLGGITKDTDEGGSHSELG